MQSKNIYIPEIILLNAYRLGLEYIRNNYKANKAAPQNSYLATVLGFTDVNVLDTRYDFYTQATSVFCTQESDPRDIKVNLFFNAARAKIPTIHITNPAELPIHDSLAINEGFQDPIVNEVTGEYTVVYSRRFKAKYNIVLTSDNTNEIVLMYQVLRSLTISMIDHLQLSGLENIKISGSDLNIKSDIVPLGVFMKNIGIEFEYDVPAVKLSTNDFLLCFKLQGVVINVNDESISGSECKKS
jgi:hypothetical protein